MKLWPKKKRGRRQSDSPRRVLIKQIVFGVLLITLLAGLLYGVWYVTRLPALTINTVEVVGGETISPESIQQLVNDGLRGDYFRLIPHRFVWFYPHDDIVASIEAKSRIKHAHLERNKQTLIAAFEEYRPNALWCERLTSTECLFLDRDGYAFASAPKLQGSAFLRFSITDRAPVVGETIFDKEFIENTTAFIDTVYTELGFNIIQVEYTPPDELTYHVAGGGLIKVSMRMSAEETFDNLVTILTSDDFAHLKPGNFKYIDLRYGNKVFINEEMDEPENNEAATSSEDGAAQ
ncbi:hypothetical protein KC722_00920 [Candidatus Kaiserbacteria bacterium]|nr:hypothetical protein [Candidatus Kaiserbacteria bacterium]